MRRALTGAVAAAVLVVAVTGAFTMMSGSTGHAREQSVAAELDKLHAARPVAAYRGPARPDGLAGTRPLPPSTVTAIAREYVSRYVAAVLTARQRAFFDNLNAFLASLEPRQQPRRVPTRRHAARAWSSSGGRGDFFACVRHHESRGQYNVVNRSSGAAGAYQFMPSTWNNAARSAGRSDLVGVNPSAASPTDQDAMAHYVYSTQGARPWTGSGCH